MIAASSEGRLRSCARDARRSAGQANERRARTTSREQDKPNGLKNTAHTHAQRVLIGGDDGNHIATQKLAAIARSELSSCGSIYQSKPHNCQIRIVGKQ